MPVNFDFNDPYAFAPWMEYGSWLAAESICLSQPAPADASKKLETALGNRLFDRTTRCGTLTPLYGQNFAERSEQLLAHVETVLADISQASKARALARTVATVPSAAYYFMPEIIRSFQARYPRCASG